MLHGISSNFFVGKTKVKITSQGYLSDNKPKGSGGHSKIIVKHIYGSGSQRWSPMERGYNVYVIHEYEGRKSLCTVFC